MRPPGEEDADIGELEDSADVDDDDDDDDDDDVDVDVDVNDILCLCELGLDMPASCCNFACFCE